jgi:hypothetical protein
VVRFRMRDSDAGRHPERAPVLCTDLLVSVQRPRYLVHVQVRDAVTARGQVVLAGLGDGQVRETLTGLRDSGFEGYLSLQPQLAVAGRFGGFSGADRFPARLQGCEGPARKSVGAVAVNKAGARRQLLQVQIGGGG